MTGIIILINMIFADESGLMFVQGAGGSVDESMTNENTTIDDGKLREIDYDWHYYSN